MAFDSELHRISEAPAANDLDLLMRLGVCAHYGREEEIYAQEDEADTLYQVVSGAVRTCRISSDGRRQIAAFYYPGDVFGIEKGAAHRFSAEALGETLVVSARKAALVRAAGAEALERFVAVATARELERAQDHLLSLGCKTACEKVARFLSDLSDRTGRQTIELPMGRQDIADYLGLTIETVSRMVTQLQAGSIVEFPTCRQFVIRNRAALDRLAA